MNRLLAAVAMVFAAIQVSPAQMGLEPGRYGVTIAPQFSVPVGNFDDWATYGYGGLVTADYTVAPNIALTASSGYLWWPGEDVTVAGGATVQIDDWNAIPFLVGAQVFPIPGMYLGVESGIHFFTNDDGNGEFSIAPMIGFQYTVGGVGLDILANYTYMEDTAYVGARIGFRLVSVR